VAVTRDADTFRLFLNGLEVARRTTTGHIMQPYNPVSMLLGARFQSDEVTPGDFFHGRMRDVRLYSRPLSGAELAIIASASRPAPSGRLLIGADVSWVPQQEAEGRRFSVDGVEQDGLSISQSFAYNYDDNEESLGPPARLIHRFVDIVSRNGNLAIIGGPTASGRYPDNVVQRLKALGAWLKVNGEAIYATRVLPPYQEGHVAYTRNKDGRLAYAICKQWPGASLRLKWVRAEEGAQITMLGVAQPLLRQQNDQGLTIAIPESLQDDAAQPCRHAWAIRIPRQPQAVISQSGFNAPVTLACLGVCDRVVYTLDGCEPTLGSTVYSAPVALPAGTTVFKARCLRSGRLVGQTACAQFQTSPPVPPRPDVDLDTLEPVSFKTGWQAEGVKTWRNVNCHGQPLKVGKETFARLEGATDTSILRIVAEDNADGIHGDNIDLVDAGFVIPSRSAVPGS
jgi:hypothetical protein